jgi:hypothetical protein
MKRIHSAVLALAVFGIVAQAQPARRAFIQSVGQASVSIKPDQAQIQFAVLTTATTSRCRSSSRSSGASGVTCFSSEWVHDLVPLHVSRHRNDVKELMRREFFPLK